MSKFIYDENHERFDIEDALTITRGIWSDENPNGEDRIGLFVTADNYGLEVTIAESESYICGVTVENDAFLGLDKDDPKYCVVQSLGVCIVKDDGTLVAGDKCMPADDGTATKSSNNLGFRVVNRVDTNYVGIIISPNNDMVQRIIKDVTELQGTTITGTLNTGSTTLTLSDGAITTDSTLDVYTDDYKVSPKNVTCANGNLTLEFKAQTKDVNVKVVVR